MKIAIITRRQSQIIYISLVCILSIAILYLFYNTVSTEAARKRMLPIYSVDTNQKKIALTFDCAWENSDTQILLELLESNNIKATFFVTGDFCERYPKDIKLFYNAGHSIQNHSNKHPHVKNISRADLIKDTVECDEIITNITGEKPTLYRAPYGEYSDNMLKVFKNDLKHKVIQWDCDSVDWQGPPIEKMISRINKNIKDGSIILFHNDTKNTPQALAKLIPQLKNQGYEFVLVKDLIYYDNYYIDHTGKQIKLN